MQKDLYERVISFLLGASWAFVIFGALLTFKTFINLGLGLALSLTIFFIFIALFFILALDAFLVNKKRLQESKKQTELLEKIYSKHTK
jgi:Zn-dependent membrane protease YugP